MADRYQPYGSASSNPYQPYPPQHGYHGYQRPGAAPPPPPPPGFHHVPPGPPPPMQHPGGFDQPQHAIKRIPSHFSQTSEFLDSNNGKCGLNLQRHIQSTAWSRKEQLQGVPIESLRLVDVLNRGWDDEGLRFISQGYEQNVVLVKDRKEAIFVSFLLKQLRSQKWDLDQLAHTAHLQTSSSPPDKISQSEAFWKPLVQEVQTSLSKFAVQPTAQDPGMAKQLEALQSQMANMTPRKPKVLPTETPPSAVVPKKRTANMALEPGPDAKRLLRDSAPSSEKKSDIKKWMDSVRHELSEEQQVELSSFIELVSKDWQNSNSVKRPNLKDVAAQWGLPVTYAAKWKEQNLLTVIAVAAFKTI